MMCSVLLCVVFGLPSLDTATALRSGTQLVACMLTNVSSLPSFFPCPLCLGLSEHPKQAGVSGLWYKYVGLDGKVVGVDKFGMSAPGDIVMKEYGMTAENLVEECKSYM